MTEQPHIQAFGSMIEPATLRIQRVLNGAPETVWRYLTDGELRRKWLAAGPMEQATGGAFEFIWRNDELTRAPGKRPEGFAEEQRMQGRVLAIDPPRSLEISWGDQGGSVRFTLEPRGERTVLTLVHRRLADAQRLAIGAGWHMHLDIMTSLLAGQQPSSFWDGWIKLRADYEQRLAG